MRRTVSARDAAAEIALCPRCLEPEHRGLCFPCSFAVLPQLKHPAWHRDAHRGERHNDAQKALSPAGEKIRQRKARNAEKASDRLQRALSGQYTRSARSAPALAPLAPVAA